MKTIFGLLLLSLTAQQAAACPHDVAGQWFYAEPDLPQLLQSPATLFGFRLERLGGQIYDVRISDGSVSHFHAILERKGRRVQFLDIYDGHRVVMEFEILNDCILRAGARLAIRHEPDKVGMWFLDIAPLGTPPLTRRHRASQQ